MKPKICVSGSAANNCGKGAYRKSWEVGYEIVKQGGILVTGATIGVPEWATRGAMAAAKKFKILGAVSIGLSPASSMREHVQKYHLPTKNMEPIIFTGFDYSGRNLFLIRTADAVIEICGRIGTLNEFTIAFEDRKPIGVLLGTGGTVEDIPKIVEDAHRGQKNIIYDMDPTKMVSSLIKEVKIRNKLIAKEEKNVHQRRMTAQE